MSTAVSVEAGAPPVERDVVFDVSHTTLRFGGVTSLNDVSLQMYRGEILAVIGPNGAGKTSLFNSLTGVYVPQEGQILLSGRQGDPLVSVLGRKTHVVNQMGVARTFQNIRLFPALTVLENVKIGVETRQRSGAVSAMLGLPIQRREERASTDAAGAPVAEGGRRHRAHEPGRSPPYRRQPRVGDRPAPGPRPRRA